MWRLDYVEIMHSSAKEPSDCCADVLAAGLFLGDAC